MIGYRLPFAAALAVSIPLLSVSLHAPSSHSARAIAKEPMVVTVDWLAQHYKDPDIVLLQVGDKAEYDKEHIPGARFIQLDDISTPHDMNNKNSLMLEFPAPEALRASFAKLGISDNSHVIVCYGSDWITPATRVIHTLNYIGLGDRASLLDGGMGAWKKASHPVTDAATASANPGRLTAVKTNDVTVTGDWVFAHLHKPGIAIVDARAKAFFDGTGTTSQRKGHIPGAVSLSFEEIANDDNMLYDKQTLAKKFADAGIAPNDTIIAYCHIGQQGTAVVFAARLLGRNVKLYDGSFQDWNNHDSYPVDNPSARSGGSEK
jgi:thiosulfate/3-mercaptopyruvate sulfurtransferase